MMKRPEGRAPRSDRGCVSRSAVNPKEGQGKFVHPPQCCYGGRVRLRASGPLRLEQPRSVLERGIYAASTSLIRTIYEKFDA